MADFYEEWLDRSARNAAKIAGTPRVAKASDRRFVRTRQDARAALIVAPETGFATAGSLLMQAEIPVGWHTGVHSHGEEAIYILDGEGALLLDDRRYDFSVGTVIHVPFASRHQLVNTGDRPVSYLSALAWPLEAFVHMGRLEQLEDAGPNDPARSSSLPAEQSQCWPGDGRRIALRRDQYLKAPTSGHGSTYYLMRGKDLAHTNGFKSTAAAISHIFVERPRSKSHGHAHPEAYLYVLEGSGYSEIDGAQHPWEKGDVVHIPPGMLHHQHVNPTDGEAMELRFEFGIRYWFTDQWHGFRSIDREKNFTSIGG